MMVNSTLFVNGFTAFIDPMVAAFGWSVAQISLAAGMRTVESGLFNPLWGRAVDKYRVRWLALIGLFTMCLGIFLLGLANSLFLLFASYIIIGLGSSLVSSQIVNTLVARWFRQNLGKATGLLTAGMGVAGLFVPLLVKMIDTYSYQRVLFFVAIGVFIIGVPLSLVFRDRPEDYGLLPDGKPRVGSTPLRRSSDVGMTVKETIKTPAFWLVNASGFLYMGAAHSVVLYIMPYLTGVGMTRSTASLIATAGWVLTAAGRPLFGWLSDTIGVRYATAIGLVGNSLAVLLLWFINDAAAPLWLIALFVFLFSLGLSGVTPLRVPFTAEYFGTKHFGTIFGLTSVFMMLAQLVVTPAVGWFYDVTGDYRPAWLLLGSTAMIGTVLMLVISKHPPYGRNKAANS
ncbi:MAG: MFS transporter [Chloroflexota bacterium]